MPTYTVMVQDMALLVLEAPSPKGPPTKVTPVLPQFESQAKYARELAADGDSCVAIADRMGYMSGLYEGDHSDQQGEEDEYVD